MEAVNPSRRNFLRSRCNDATEGRDVSQNYDSKFLPLRVLRPPKVLSKCNRYASVFALWEKLIKYSKFLDRIDASAEGWRMVS